MEREEVKEAFKLLEALCNKQGNDIIKAYRLLRNLIEQICLDETADMGLQMTDLAAKINYLATSIKLNNKDQNRLHTFRMTANMVLNHIEAPTTEKLLRDIKTIAFLLRTISKEDIPSSLMHYLPTHDTTYHSGIKAKQVVKQMRVCFHHADESFLYVSPTNFISSAYLKVNYNVEGINQVFTETCHSLWKHAQLNLLDIKIDENGILIPAFIVLEPDYLLDISTLAECFKDYGHHPKNYILSRLQPIDNARPLLLGNIANLFLDEWIYNEQNISYKACMQKVFRQYAIEILACSELHDKEKERAFFKDCEMHYEHIRQTIQDMFLTEGYKLNKDDAVLEPSYICEALGLQGRLDYLQRDMSALIEMKSGKADEYSVYQKITPRENNWVQMLLYMAVLQYSMGIDHHQQTAYLLYTRYPLLYPARSSWAMVKRAIEVRNQIVATEYNIQLHNNIAYTAEVLNEITPELLNEKGITGRFWQQYLYPSISKFHNQLAKLDELEKKYFYALYTFITKELYTSKSGDIDYEGKTGASALWLSTLEEKEETGEILYNLHISESNATISSSPHIIFKQSTIVEPGKGLPNFREGDAIVLYQRNKATDNVTNKLIFKGNIAWIAGDKICMRLRAAQRNSEVLPQDASYAIEHDYMDTSFRYMFLGLNNFLTTNKARRDLLLAQREPRVDESKLSIIQSTSDDFTRIALKAEVARDYFLLIGPPGTGKTSCALKKMVETFYQKPSCQLLLLAYTNRAVDEICKSISKLSIDYIRIGNELTCNPSFHPHLMENVLEGFTNRKEVSNRLECCRVFVGTVTAIMGKSELFKLKTFDVAIIDEATQILEPQLLGLLCAHTNELKDSIKKFILIGDHKQLPAVILQSDKYSTIQDESLNAIGLYNLKDSLFERLYRKVRTQVGSSNCFDMLSKQGRMHPLIAEFPNKVFYENKLVAVGLPHQLESNTSNIRLKFIPSKPEPFDAPCKINHDEARIVTQLAEKIIKETPNFEANYTLGIITTYRSQIALIKQYLHETKISALNDITVDTVERYQGSERDIIIYSFCVNRHHQLKFLNNTIVDNGHLIDRKLNVALTRARKQLFITGVPEILKQSPIYRKLLSYLGE